jgi:hypothetical protein
LPPEARRWQILFCPVFCRGSEYFPPVHNPFIDYQYPVGEPHTEFDLQPGFQISSSLALNKSPTPFRISPKVSTLRYVCVARFGRGNPGATTESRKMVQTGPLAQIAWL